MTLAVAVLLATLGFSAMTTIRINTRKTTGTNDWTEAGILAFSAVEYGIRIINSTPLWRTTFPSGTIASLFERSLGRGTFSLTLVDEEDGDLTDQIADPIRLYGMGYVGDAVRVHSVLIQPNTGLDILRSAIHAGTFLQVKGGKELMPTGAPVSCNGTLDNDELIYGDAETVSTGDTKVITGITTILTTPKEMPASNLIDTYISKATTIPYTGQIANQVLSPGHNPWGEANADGLYFLDTLGNDVDIIRSRIHGTLIVRTGGKTLKLIDFAFLHNYRSDYPVLIVDGKIELKLKSDDYELSESMCAINFNPVGSPYEDDEDTDLLDSYPNEIHGLIHATDAMKFFESTRIRGVVIGETTITIEGSNQIVFDPSLYEHPPMGYTSSTSPMAIVPGSWRWDNIPE